MKITTRIKLKMFALDFLFELIINSAILSVAYFSNLVVETLFFYLSWRVFRQAFPKLFHIRAKSPLLSILGCLCCSFLVFIISMRLMLPIGISIFSSVIVGVLVNSALYHLQEYLDLKRQITNQTIDIYKMSEDDLRNYAKSKHLSEMMIDTLILKVINNYKWCEIMEERNYSRTAIKYHKKCIENKLNIKL